MTSIPPSPTRQVRRSILKISGAGLLAALTGCGAAGIGAEEGDDFFTWDVKLLNLAATETSVSISDASGTYFSNAAYGQVSTKTLVLDDFVVKGATLKVTGASGVIVNLSPMNIGPGLYLLTSQADSKGNTTGFSVSIVGGVPGRYDSQGVGHSAQSIIKHQTAAVGTVDVHSRFGATGSLQKIGSLSNGGTLNINPSSTDSFQLVFKDPATGNTLYDSGAKAKSANTLFVIARSAAKSDNWTVFAVGADFAAVTWPSI